MVSIQSVKIESGRVCVTLGSGTVLKVTQDAAEQVAAQLAQDGVDTVEVGAIVNVTLDDEQKANLLTRIGRLKAHLDGYTD